MSYSNSGHPEGLFIFEEDEGGIESSEDEDISDKDATESFSESPKEYTPHIDAPLLDEKVLFPPTNLKDGLPLIEFINSNIHKFQCPYAYIGGEANTIKPFSYKEAGLRILVARPSTYNTVAYSMTHSLMSQIYHELPYVFTDFAFLPMSVDFNLFKSNSFPVWFGINTKFSPLRFDVLSISKSVILESLNIIPLLYESGIPIFKSIRLDRPDIPLIFLGGSVSCETAHLNGTWTSSGSSYYGLVDAVIYGEGEVAAKQLMSLVYEGKQKGLTKREILESCHGRVDGFYEPDKYIHTYDGKGTLLSIAPVSDKYEFPVHRATVTDLNTVKPLENRILNYSPVVPCVEVAAAGSTGCVGCISKGSRVLTSRGQVPIESIRVGDTVVTSTGVGVVREVKCTGIKPVYRVTTIDGYSLSLTANHRISFFSKDDNSTFKPVSSLTLSDSLKIRVGVSTSSLSSHFSSDLFYLFGYFMVGFTTSTSVNVPFPSKVSALLVSTFPHLSLQIPLHFPNCLSLSPSSLFFPPSSYPFLQELVECTSLPSVVWGGTTSDKLSFLRGFIDSLFFSFESSTFVVPSSFLPFLKEVQCLFLDLGVFTSITKPSPTSLSCNLSLSSPSFPTIEPNPLQHTFSKVESITPLPPTEVYDLSISGSDPSYTVRGIVVHNSAGWGACSFCQAGSLSPYRERSADNIMKSLEVASKRQGIKDVSFYSLNCNSHSSYFSLLSRSAQESYRILFSSQRIDILAGNLDQLRAQRWFGKSNYTLGFEGISDRIRAYLNKNLTEDQIIPVLTELMKLGARQLKLLFILTYKETKEDIEEFLSLMDNLTSLRTSLGSRTQFRLSFCLHEDTHIFTSIGFIKLKSLAPPPPPPSPPLPQGTYHPLNDLYVINRFGYWTRATHLYYNGFQDTLTLSLSDGRSISCTPEHRFINHLTDSWICAKDITRGTVLTQLPSFYPPSPPLSPSIVVLSVTPSKSETYDLVVPDGNSYIAEGLISHNTPLFPSSFTVLQFAPVSAVTLNDSSSLSPIFSKAKELKWGCRFSACADEVRVTNFLRQAGRNVTPLLLHSYFSDSVVYQAGLSKGVWDRWKSRIDLTPSINLPSMWGEKDLSYIFPWDDIAYSTSKETLWKGYLRSLSFQGESYCLTTNAKKGKCHGKSCGACDPHKSGRLIPSLVKGIVSRSISPTLSSKDFDKLVCNKDTSYRMRVLITVDDPIYRFISKVYILNAVSRAFRLSSDVFNKAFIRGMGHIRSPYSSHDQLDWVYGKNILDISLSSPFSESELRSLIPIANTHFTEGRIIDIRLDTLSYSLTGNIDFVQYLMFVPFTHYPFSSFRTSISQYFERNSKGKSGTVKVKKVVNRTTFKLESVSLSSTDVRQVDLMFRPDLRGTVLRIVVSSKYTILSMLETILGRRTNIWKPIPIYCERYISIQDTGGDVDLFATIFGSPSTCSFCGGPFELDLFTGQSPTSGFCMVCDQDQYPYDPSVFSSTLLLSRLVTP